jgi:hypothetical protein
MYVVYRRPEVPLGPDGPIKTTMPDLSPSTAVFAIPGKRRTAVELSKSTGQLLQLIRLDQNVVMVRQYAPGVRLAAKLPTG